MLWLVEPDLMWSGEVSSHWRSKSNLGRNTQCVLCAWPTDGRRHTQARMCALTKSEMRSRNYTHLHAHIESHSISHHMSLIWKEWEKSCTLPHTCKHMLRLTESLTHVFMVTHTVHKAVLLHAHWWSATFFLSLSWTCSCKSHTQRDFSLHASLHSTFNPETGYFITFTAQRITINFSLLLGVWHVLLLSPA